jgi:hypothetical protein
VNVVGQMVVRNEVDVIAEAVGEAFRWVDDLVVLDGASDDGTLETLGELAAWYDGAGGKRLHLTSEPDPEDGELSPVNLNVLRARLQGLTAGLSPDWVLSVDADEIYHAGSQGPDPVAAINAAEEAGANVVRCFVPQFWLSFDDLRNGALHEDASLSIRARRRWYSWGHMGTFIWKWNDAHYYPDRPSKRTPELPGLSWREWQVAGPLTPVCKHYPIRTLEQGLRRARERLERGGRWQFGKYEQNWVIDERLAHLHRWDGGAWNTEPNHRLLKAYMAGEHILPEGEA